MIPMWAAWALLVVAVSLELAGTTLAKLSEGLTRLTPSVLMYVFYAVSFSLLALVLRVLDLSVVYPIWGAIGTSTITVIGIFYFKESASLWKLISIGVIVAAVVSLNLSEIYKR